MSPTKTSFQRQEDLAKWWVSVCKDPRFSLVCIYAMAEFAGGSSIDGAELFGAKGIIRILGDLCEQEIPAADSLPQPHLESVTEEKLRKLRNPKFLTPS